MLDVVVASCGVVGINVFPVLLREENPLGELGVVLDCGIGVHNTTELIESVDITSKMAGDVKRSKMCGGIIGTILCGTDAVNTVHGGREAHG
jgi:hypothetical protein